MIDRRLIEEMFCTASKSDLEGRRRLPQCTGECWIWLTANP